MDETQRRLTALTTKQRPDFTTISTELHWIIHRLSEIEQELLALRETAGILAGALKDHLLAARRVRRPMPMQLDGPPGPSSAAETGNCPDDDK